MPDLLNGYDMVWAITQGTLNAQLNWLFTKLPDPNQPDPLHAVFGDLTNNGFHVDAYLDVPQIEIAEGNDSTVYLYLPFASGTMQHYGFPGISNLYTIDFTPDPNNPSTTTWMLCFKTDLNINDITSSLNCSSGTPPNGMHEETFQKLCNFVSSDFTVQQIFLDLQNVDMVTFLPNKSQFPTTITATLNGQPNQPDPQAQSVLSLAMSSYFQSLKADTEANPYVLGYAATYTQNDVSAFQPTGTVYSTNCYSPPPGHPTDTDLSTFNFLLETHHKTPPTTNLGFNYNLVDGSVTGISGTGRVANQTVVNDWLANTSLAGGCLIQGLANAAGISMDNMSYNATTYCWTGSQQTQQDDQKFLWATAHVYSINSLSVQFSASVTDSNNVSGPGLAVSGTMGARYEFNTGICNGDYTRTQPFSMSIVMQPGVGSDGNGTITLSSSAVTTGDASDASNLGGACKIPGIKQAMDALVASLVKDPLARIDSFEVTGFSGAVSGALSTLSNQIIMPAPSVFAYKDLSFNGEFDLVADFSYITSNQ